ncbi:MAG: acyltransferase family protein [Eubacterium sp.]|nr:acyltransferase family protein [Eubacterium sp.]
MEKTNNTRIPLYDNLKFLLICCVVVGHWCAIGDNKTPIYQFVMVFLYSFHPLFFFISGLFYKREKAVDRAVEFTVIGFMLKVLYVLMFVVSNFKSVSDYTNVFKFFGDPSPAWFIITLAAYYILAYLLKNMDLRVILAVSVLVVLCVGYDTQVSEMIYLTKAVRYFPFFILGRMCTTEKVEKVRSIIPLKIVAGILLIVWAAVIVKDRNIEMFKLLFTGADSYVNFPKEYMLKNGPVIRFLTDTLSGVIAACWLILMPNKQISPFSQCGSKIIQVYFWHLPFLVPFDKLGIPQKLSNHGAVVSIVSLLIPFALILLLSLKPFAYPVKLIRKRPEKEIQ